MTKITNFSKLISPPSNDSYHHLQPNHITTFKQLRLPPSDDSYHHLQMTNITAFSWLISPPLVNSDHYLKPTHITTFRWLISPPSANSDHHLQLTQIWRRWYGPKCHEGGDMVLRRRWYGTDKVTSWAPSWSQKIHGMRKVFPLSCFLGIRNTYLVYFFGLYAKGPKN